MANESENREQIPSSTDNNAPVEPILEETVVVKEEIPAPVAGEAASASSGGSPTCGETGADAGARPSGAVEGVTPVPPKTMDEVIAEETGQPLPQDEPETRDAASSAAATGTDADTAAGEPQPQDYVEPLPDGSKRVIPADRLEKVPFKTSVGQWWFIAIATLILIVIAATFHDAGPRENHAAQATFSVLAKPIIDGAAEDVGLRTSYGYPIYTLTARIKEADVFAQFMHGPIPPARAAEFGLLACERLARAYVVKGYMARHITVHVYSRQETGPRRYYGKAIYNGNLDDLIWENAPETING